MSEEPEEPTLPEGVEPEQPEAMARGAQTGRYSGRPCGGNPYPSSVKNGRIPRGQLRRCESQPHFDKKTLRGHLYGPAAVMLDALATKARADGVTARCVALYRDLDEQVRMRKVWCDRGKCSYAAVPGTSNHGWGVAADFERHQPGTTGIVNWLKANSIRYGWDSPRWAMDGTGTEEPWHWQWIDGFVPSPQEPDIVWTAENGDRYLTPGEHDEGSVGPVHQLQKALRAWAWERQDIKPGDNLEIDGWYGTDTRDVVRIFQTDQGIVPSNRDMWGTAGPTTRARLSVLTGIHC